VCPILIIIITGFLWIELEWIAILAPIIFIIAAFINQGFNIKIFILRAVKVSLGD
jgi:hypothetical protein